MTYSSLIVTFLIASFPLTAVAAGEGGTKGHAAKSSVSESEQQMNYAFTDEERRQVQDLFRNANDRCRYSKMANCYEQERLKNGAAEQNPGKAVDSGDNDAERARIMEEEQEDDEEY